MSHEAKLKNYFVKTKTLSDEENQLRLSIIKSFMKYRDYAKVLSKFEQIENERAIKKTVSSAFLHLRTKLKDFGSFEALEKH